MDLVAEDIDGAVVLNLEGVCTGLDGQECRGCVDIGGLIHNWMMSTEVRYIIVDMQDEKDLCKTFLVELLQLRKRLKIPFMFSGVMERPRKVLMSYALEGTGKDIFTTPEEAVQQLKTGHPQLLKISFENVVFGEPIVSLKARQLQRAAEAEEVNNDDI